MITPKPEPETAPHFEYKMPEWYNRVAFLWRGVCLGFVAGYILAMRLHGKDPTISAVFVILSASILGVLPSVPKAYIEQRNRIRAWRDARLTAPSRLRILAAHIWQNRNLDAVKTSPPSGKPDSDK